MIEDVEADFLLVARHIRNSGLDARLTWVKDGQELSAALEAGAWDLVLSDYKVVGLDFMETLELVKHHLAHVPVILISGSVGEETAVELLKQGVADFVLKDRLFRLIPAIERSLNEEIERSRRREAEARFSTIIDNAKSAVWVKDLDGKFLVINAYLQNLLKKTADEALGRTAFDLLPREAVEEIVDNERQVLLSGAAVEVEESIHFPDGQHCFLSAKFPLKDGTGKINALGAICTDITALKQTEALLKEREQQFRQMSQEYRTLLDNLPDGIVHLSPDLHIQWVNEAAQRMFNLEEDALSSGKCCHEVFWNKASRCTACPVVRSLDSRCKEMGCFTPEGDGREFEIRAVPMVDKNGELEGIIEIVRDITSHRNLEEQFRQAQKMESIGTLAGGIAHDFNNILSAVLGYGEFALEDLAEDHRARKSVQTIIEAGMRASHLTKDLLLFSRKQISRKEPADINQILSRIEKFIRRIIGEDIHCATILANEPLVIFADSHQVDQVLMNFATNARDAMPAGGHFSISTERLELDQDFIDTHGFGSPGPYARITVTDTGKGMDKQTAAKIFEPFFTTKEMGKGTGLGLAVVYGIIKDHQGYINVYSEPGKGTTLTVYLSLIENERRDHQESSGLEKPRGGRETILLAEDDATVRELFSRVLTQYGYTVVEAMNGEEAIRLFAQRRGAIDLVLFDLVMPKMNGKQAFESIQRLQPDIKAIFISGYAPENIQLKELLDLHIDILPKPVSPRKLLRTVRDLLDAPHPPVS
jgi:PAS domain S-box-containing protein